MKKETNKETGIDYRPKDYKPEEMVNDIPGLGTQPLDSGISVRGKVYISELHTISSGTSTYTVDDIPFKPSIVEITAVVGGGSEKSFSVGRGAIGQTSYSTLEHSSSGYANMISTSIIAVSNTSGDVTLASISKYTNRGFILDLFVSELDIKIQYTAYA